MKHHQNILYSFLTVVIFFMVGFFLIKQNPEINLNKIQYIKIAGVNVKVDLALTEAEQEQGLSGRQNLANNEGMLFIFDKPDKYLFWMKNMNFPIDMIWVGQDMKVVYIKKDARPELYPETYGPRENDQPAKYVLEVTSGFTDKNNLKIGDTAQFLTGL